MPFKSKAQYRLFQKKEADGELSTGTTARWMDETEDFDELPERLGIKKQGNDMTKYSPPEIDHVNTSFDMIMDALVPQEQNNRMEKTAVLGQVADLSFKFLPSVAFGLPFTLGGIYHLMNRELNAQRTDNKQRMHDLTSPFQDLLDKRNAKEESESEIE